ncbi:MAG: beta-propeller fold lactonase family protein [Gaiellales bacterium]
MKFSRTSIVAIISSAAAIGLVATLLVQDGDTSSMRSSGTEQSTRASSRAILDAPGTLWVANEDGNSLTAIDAATGKVVSTISGIESPHNVQASDDGSSVWAVSGEDSSLTGITQSSASVLGTGPTGTHPAHVVLDRAGRRAYVSNSGADSVSAIDLTTMQTLAEIPVGSFPHGMRISPNGRTLLVANMKSGSVTFIDTRKLEPIDTIKVGDAPVQVAFDRAGAAFVSLNGENAVAKIDLAQRRVVSKQPTGVGPAQTFVTADGTLLLVANQGTESDPSNTLSILNTTSMKLVGTVETGRGAHGITADPSSRYAFVTNMYDDDVAVVDLTKLKTVSRISVGDTPNGITWSSALMPKDAAARVKLPMQAKQMTENDDHDMAGMEH